MSSFRGNWEVAVTASWNSIDGRRETAGVHYGNSAVVEVKQEEVVKVKQEERGISNMNAPLSKETPRMQASAAGGSSAVATSTARATAASTASTARATAASAASTATATAASATNTARGASAKRVVRDNSVDGVMPSPSKRAAIAKSVADSLVDAMTARANASINVGTESDVEIKLQRYKAENEGLRRVVAVKNTELIVLRERDETGFTWKQEHRAERAEAKLKVSVAGAALTNASCASLQAVVVKLKGDNELANASRASLQAQVSIMKAQNELANASRASLHAVVFKLKGDNELANASRASLQAEVAKMKNNAEMMIHWIKERDMALHRHGEIALYRSQHITHLQNCLVAAWQTSQTTPH
jgi:hypothetical protein